MQTTKLWIVSFLLLLITQTQCKTRQDGDETLVSPDPEVTQTEADDTKPASPDLTFAAPMTVPDDADDMESDGLPKTIHGFWSLYVNPPGECTNQEEVDVELNSKSFIIHHRSFMDSECSSIATTEDREFNLDALGNVNPDTPPQMGLAKLRIESLQLTAHVDELVRKYLATQYWGIKAWEIDMPQSGLGRKLNDAGLTIRANDHFELTWNRSKEGLLHIVLRKPGATDGTWDEKFDYVLKKTGTAVSRKAAIPPAAPF